MRLTRAEAYSILGLQEGSSDDDVRKAYKSQALKWHPDKNKNSTESTERFKAISEAYARLKAPNEDDDEFEMDEDMFDDDMFDDLPHEFFFFFARMMGGQRRRNYSSSMYTTYDAPCDCAQCRMRARAAARSYKGGYAYRDPYSYAESPPREANKERAEKAREAQSREESEAMERWLRCQLRLKLVSTSDYNIQATLEAITVPAGCVWEASYRKDSDPSAAWTSVVPKKNGNIYAGNLRPGTDYLFRARPGKSGTYTWSGVAEYTSSWGPAVLLSTTGIAPEYSNDGKKGKKKQSQKQQEAPVKAESPRPAPANQSPPKAAEKKAQKGKGAQGASSTGGAQGASSTNSAHKQKEASVEEKERLRLQKEAREAAEREKDEQRKKERERQAALEKAAQEKLRQEELEREKQKEKDRQAAMEHAAAEYDSAVAAAAAQRVTVDKRKDKEREKQKDQLEQQKQQKERAAAEARAKAEAKEREEADVAARAQAEAVLKAEEEARMRARAEEDGARYRAKAEALLRQTPEYLRKQNKGTKSVEINAGDSAGSHADTAPSSEAARNQHTEPCKYFLRGQCLRGDACWYLHDQTARNKLMELKYNRKARTTPVSSPGTAPATITMQVPVTQQRIPHTPPKDPGTRSSNHIDHRADLYQSTTPSGGLPASASTPEQPTSHNAVVRPGQPATAIEDPISAMEQKMIEKAIEESLRYQQYYQTAVHLTEQDFPDLGTARDSSRAADSKNPVQDPKTGSVRHESSHMDGFADSADHVEPAHKLDYSKKGPSSAFSDGAVERLGPDRYRALSSQGNDRQGKAENVGHVTEMQDVYSNGFHALSGNNIRERMGPDRASAKGILSGQDMVQHGGQEDPGTHRDQAVHAYRHVDSRNTVSMKEMNEGRHSTGSNGTSSGKLSNEDGPTGVLQRAVNGRRGVDTSMDGMYSNTGGSTGRGPKGLHRKVGKFGAGSTGSEGTEGSVSGESEKSESVREGRKSYVGKVMRPYPVPVPTPVQARVEQQPLQQYHAKGGGFPHAAVLSQRSAGHMESNGGNTLQQHSHPLYVSADGNGPGLGDKPVGAEKYHQATGNGTRSYTTVPASQGDIALAPGEKVRSKPVTGCMPMPVPVPVPVTGCVPMPVPVPVPVPFDANPLSRTLPDAASKLTPVVGRMPVPVPVHAPPTSRTSAAASTPFELSKPAGVEGRMPVPMPVPVPVPMPVSTPTSSSYSAAGEASSATFDYSQPALKAERETNNGALPGSSSSRRSTPPSRAPQLPSQAPAASAALQASPEEEDLDLLTFGIGFSEVDEQIQEELDKERAAYDMGSFNSGFGSFGAATQQLPAGSNAQQSAGLYYSSSLPSYSAGPLAASSPSTPAFGSSLPDPTTAGVVTSLGADLRIQLAGSSPFPGSTLPSTAAFASHSQGHGLSVSGQQAFSKIASPVAAVATAVATSFSPASHADFSGSFADWGPPTPGGTTWGPPTIPPSSGVTKPPAPNARGNSSNPPARTRFPVPAPLSLPNGITNPSHLLSPSLSNVSMLSPSAKVIPDTAERRTAHRRMSETGTLTQQAEAHEDELSPTAPGSLLNLLISHHDAQLDGKAATPKRNVSSSSPMPRRLGPSPRPYNPLQAQTSAPVSLLTGDQPTLNSTADLPIQPPPQPAAAASATLYSAPPAQAPAGSSATAVSDPAGVPPPRVKPLPMPTLPDSIDPPPVKHSAVSTIKPAVSASVSTPNTVKHPVPVPVAPVNSAINPAMQYAYFTPAMPPVGYVPGISYPGYGPAPLYYDATMGMPAVAQPYFYPAVPHVMSPAMPFGVAPAAATAPHSKTSSSGSDRQAGAGSQSRWPL